MKKILLTTIYFLIIQLCLSQSLVLRTNLQSNIRPLPTANLSIGYLNISEETEVYLSLEKAYSSMERILHGRFQPDNKKVNLEYGIGLRESVASFVIKEIRIYLFCELEYAKLNYLYKEPNKWVSSVDWWFGTKSYDSDGIIHVSRYKFERFQLLTGLGVKLAINKKMGLDFSIAAWRTSHKLGSITMEKDEFGGNKLIQEVRKSTKLIGEVVRITELLGSSDKYLDSDNKIKYGIQPGLSFYYIFSK